MRSAVRWGVLTPLRTNSWRWSKGGPRTQEGFSPLEKGCDTTIGTAFCSKFKATHPRRVWRMEARPGEQVRVDFGLAAPIGDEASRSRRNWVFRMVLSYSRKAYSRAVLRRCRTCPSDDFGRKDFLPVEPQGCLSFLILLGEPRFA